MVGFLTSPALTPLSDELAGRYWNQYVHPIGVVSMHQAGAAFG